MLKTIGAVVAGLIAGALVNMGISEGMTYFYPSEIELRESADYIAYVASLPNIAFLFPYFAHQLDALVAAVVITFLLKKDGLIPSLIAGAVVMISGIINLLLVEHPIWFAVVGLISYIPFAWTGHMIVVSLQKK